MQTINLDFKCDGCGADAVIKQDEYNNLLVIPCRPCIRERALISVQLKRQNFEAIYDEIEVYVTDGGTLPK